MSITWHTETRKLTDLIPSDYNPRQLSEKQGKELKRSLEKFGYVETIDINTDNTVIGGHQRLKILADLKAEEIEVRVPNRKLNKKEEKELNLRLNRNLGEFNFELLLDNFDIEMLEDVGFMPSELGMEIDDPEELGGDFNESINFIIKCENESELEALKKKIGIDKGKMSCKDFLRFLDKNV